MTRHDERDIQLRLLVDVQQATSDTRSALECGARNVLGDGWTVRRLFPQSPDTQLTRHWVVEGPVPVSPVYPVAPLAYDLAAALANHVHCTVEPDLPSRAFGPRVDVRPPGVLGGTGAPSPAAAGGSQEGHLDGSIGKDWALRKIYARQAWSRPAPAGGSARGRGVLIGHVDTGYTDHPDLERAALDLVRDRDVLDDDDDARDPLIRRWWWPLDSPGHGTMTGSVIVSRTEREIIGVAPEATLMPVRAVRSVVQVFDADVAQAVEHCRRSGCQVITMSLGGRGFPGLRDVIARAVADGIIVMAAAGNEVGFVVAPAVYPECLAVAASNADDRPWEGSSRGDAVDISAPGESVWVARVDSSTRPPRFSSDRSSGTSFAVAHLAGVAALWLAFHGPDTIRQRYGRERVQDAFLALVRSTCNTPDGWDRGRFGAGIVNADALLAVGLPRNVAEEAPVRPEFDALRRVTAAVPALLRDTAATVGSRVGIQESALPAALRRHSSELVYLFGEAPDQARALLAPVLGINRATLSALAPAPAPWPGMSAGLSTMLAGD